MFDTESDEKITRNELAGLFGQSMPIEAVQLLHNGDCLPIRVVRERLKEIADKRRVQNDPIIRDEDFKVESLRDPPGGQHVGVRTGVRVTHLPSGLMAECETDRSQHRNKAVAMDMILGGLTSPHYRG
jgi:hypothetical protein